MGRVNGKVCVISGASSGIGRATAVLLGREGATVVATGRSEERLAAVVGEIEGAGGTALAVPADLERGCGSIVSVSSMAGVTGLYDAHAYTAAKGARS